MSTKISEKNIRLTVNQKIEMINYHISNSKVTQVQIAAKFAQNFGLTHISKQTMSRIFEPNMIKKLLLVDVSNDSPSKNLPECKYSELERCLFVWFTQSQHDLIITDQILIYKAKDFGAMLGICEHDFKYSNGWLEKFKKRFGISIKTLAGEAESVDLELVERERTRLRKILDKFEAKNRFNMDDTALLYKLPANKTLGINERSNSGKKQPKHR